jgi:hypothetical protein
VTPEGIAEGALREVVAKARRREPDARVFAIRAAGYDGKPTVALDGGEQLSVHWCASVLEFRQRLAEAKEEAVVLVTASDERELGEDAIACVARGRLERADAWEPVKALFKARSISPQVMSDKWLAEALMLNVPPGGYPPAPNGVLTYDHALARLSDAVLGAAEPTTAGLLKAIENSVDEYSGSGRNQVLNALGEYHSARLGPACRVLLATAVNGHGAHVVALGLAVQVVFAEGSKGVLASEQRDAIVRLERFTGGVRVSPEAGNAWGAASERLVADAPAERAQTWMVDAERLLDELGVGSLVGLSDTLPKGFPTRVDAAVRTLARWLGDESDGNRAEALEAIDDVGRHRVATQRSVGGLEMIARLVQFAHAPEVSEPGSLREAAMRHVREGGPLDRARQALDGEFQSEGMRQLSAAVAAAIDPRRERRAQCFARLLAAATAADRDDGLLCVERVQAEVVDPVARAQPVLVVVLDGMSEAAFQSIAPSITAAGWTQVTRGGEERTPTLAALPSLTQVSRTSLLAGKLSSGSQGVESSGFTEALRGVGVARLFHRAELREGDELREVIADGDIRVVGVVVNAIDDMLAKGDQVAGEWTLERIGPLRGLLDAAAESGRAIILAADHGHVIERGSEFRSHREGGARWRPVDSGDTGDGEVVLRGRRVLMAGGALIAPAVECLRYRPKASGYHGGATPQEVIAPVAVFLPAGEEIAGFSEAVPTTPDWWDLGAIDMAAVPPPPRRRPERRENQDQLFGADPDAKGVRPGWIGQLLATQQYSSQRQRALRPPSDERVAIALEELDRRGGVAAVELISEALEVPSSRGRRIISSMQALLNVDGYGILTLDSGTNEVRLNRSMLETQFEL